MSAGQFVGRVGGIAAALGIGVAVFGGTAIAVADSGPDTPTRPSASASAHASSRATHGSRAASAAGVKSATSAQARGGAPVARTEPIADTFAAAAVSAVPEPTSNTVTLATQTVDITRAATVRTPSAALVPSPTPPSPDATVNTTYGVLGQWMINKLGEVADWVGNPYCGAGSTVANCTPTTPGAKTMQEPINTIFVVKAGSEYAAELKLDFALRISGFGPSCCSSIGYQAIVGTQTDPQMPRGGPLGLGILPPLPFGLGQTGLLGLLTGLGPAYRDAPFFLANSHLRVFGAEPDGNGNWIFTGSVSEENLDASGGGLLPTHGFESFNQARTKLTTDMVNMGWLTGATSLGMVEMNNAIPADDPTYTTGDADGMAQVIALGAMFASSPARSTRSL